jgi:hypothetical protein
MTEVDAIRTTHHRDPTERGRPASSRLVEIDVIAARVTRVTRHRDPGRPT